MAKCNKCDCVFSVYGSDGHEECPICGREVITIQAEMAPVGKRDCEAIEEIGHVIDVLKHQFIFEMKREPNQIILGIEAFQQLCMQRTVEVTMNTPEGNYFKGISISIDYDKPQEVKVGWVIK